MEDLLGRRIAMQMQFGDETRVLTGRVIAVPGILGKVNLSIQIDDPDGSSGLPILNVDPKYLLRLQPCTQFGCDYLLRCDD